MKWINYQLTENPKKSALVLLVVAIVVLFIFFPEHYAALDYALFTLSDRKLTIPSLLGIIFGSGGMFAAWSVFTRTEKKLLKGEIQKEVNDFEN